MYYLRYLCLFVHSGVQHILCCVFVVLVFVLCTLCQNPYIEEEQTTQWPQKTDKSTNNDLQNITHKNKRSSDTNPTKNRKGKQFLLH